MIPTHFALDGHPNKLGHKHLLLLVGFIDLASYILLCFAARYQKLVNLPVNVDRNSPNVQEQIRRMISTIKAITTLSFLYIIWKIIQTASGQANGLGSAFSPIFGAALILTVVFYVNRLKKYK